MISRCPAHLSSSLAYTGFLAVFLVQMWSLMTLGGSVRCHVSSEDIPVQVSSCLEEYRSFQESFQLTGSHLFTSVDVEIIRTLCSNLKTSMRCLKSVRDRCPSIQHHNEIDSAVHLYLPVVELCDHQRLYEEYAMNQNCLHGQREISEHCYRTFENHINRLDTSKRPHLQHYCGYLTELVSCVRSNFALTCGEASAMLVELLVKAAIKDSYRCRTGSLHDSTITVAPQKSSRIGSHRRSNGSSCLRPLLSRGTHLLIICLTLSMSSAFTLNRRNLVGI